jgi:uncharacterized protein DUF3105
MDLPPPPPPPPPPRRLSRSDAIFLVLALVLLVAIGTGLAWTFLADRNSEVAARSPTITPTVPSGVASSAASRSPSADGSCRPVQMVGPFDSEPGDRAHAEVPLSRYPSVPPTSGPHDPVTVPAGSYAAPPPIRQVIHSLEHGAVVIWFEPSVASSEALQEIREFMGPSGPGQGLHVIIAPYDYPEEAEAGRLPSGVAMAMVAWHRLQLCTRLDTDALAVASGFVGNYRCYPGCDMSEYTGDAPEAGVPI